MRRLVVLTLVALAVGCRPARPFVVPDAPFGKTVAIDEGNAPRLVQLSGSGELLLLYSDPAGDVDRGVARVFEAASLRLLWDAWAGRAELDPSGRRVALLSPKKPWRMEIRDARTGAVQREIGNPESAPTAFVGDGVLAMARGNAVAGIDVASGRERWLVTMPKPVLGLRAARDGGTLAVRLGDYATWIVRPADGDGGGAKKACTQEQADGPFALSPDGRVLAVKSAEGARLYETGSCRVVAVGEGCQVGIVVEGGTWLTLVAQRGSEARWMAAFRPPASEPVGRVAIATAPYAWDLAAGQLVTAYGGGAPAYGSRVTVQAAPALAGAGGGVGAGVEGAAAEGGATRLRCVVAR